MTGKVRVGIIGERDPGKPTHAATEEALLHGASALDTPVGVEWLPTGALEAGTGVMRGFDALWCAPGSPYTSLAGALKAVRFAREHSVPLIGTCGGFQHVVIEYARNVLGFVDAGHAEYDPNASCLFVSALSCSPFGKTMRVEIGPGSRVHSFYGRTEAWEEYRCNFGLTPERQQAVEGGGLRVVGTDEDGEARILELPDHPFYVATLFVPQIDSAEARPHPLVIAFLRAALGEQRRKEMPRQQVV